jgi:hypothetical protein
MAAVPGPCRADAAARKYEPSLTIVKSAFWGRVTLAHPFADFLPSFWAKGIFRTLGPKFRVSVFFLPGGFAGSSRRLIFINIRMAAKRYGVRMVLRRGNWTVCAMVKPAPGWVHRANRNGRMRGG